MWLTACAVLRLQMLGIQASEREVQEVCATAGHDGELNYLDFVGVGMPMLLCTPWRHRLCKQPSFQYCPEADRPSTKQATRCCGRPEPACQVEM